MSFIEQNLLDPLSWGFSGGPTWQTRRVGLRNGIQRRNVMRSRPLHRFSGSFDLRDDGTLATLIATFNACRGGAYGFRFHNPMDHAVSGESLGVAAGGEETWQLTRTYVFGTESVVVPVRKPIALGFELTADGVPQATTLDTTTGMVTFTANAGESIAWSGEFDLPVMFSSDEFEGSLETWNATTVEVTLEEDLSA